MLCEPNRPPASLSLPRSTQLAVILLVLLAGPAAAGPAFDLAPYSDLDLGGPGYAELGGYLPPGPSGNNQATVVQQGVHNQLNAVQWGGSNTIQAQQVGEHNIAALIQVGLYNTILLNQIGDANQAYIAQAGLNNYARAAQNGVNNLVQILQAGIGLTVTVTQNGNNNVARVIQRN